MNVALILLLGLLAWLLLKRKKAPMPPPVREPEPSPYQPPIPAIKEIVASTGAYIKPSELSPSPEAAKEATQASAGVNPAYTPAIVAAAYEAGETPEEYYEKLTYGALEVPDYGLAVALEEPVELGPETVIAISPTGVVTTLGEPITYREDTVTGCAYNPLTGELLSSCDRGLADARKMKAQGWEWLNIDYVFYGKYTMEERNALKRELLASKATIDKYYYMGLTYLSGEEVWKGL